LLFLGGRTIRIDIGAARLYPVTLPLLPIRVSSESIPKYKEVPRNVARDEPSRVYGQKMHDGFVVFLYIVVRVARFVVDTGGINHEKATMVAPWSYKSVVAKRNERIPPTHSPLSDRLSFTRVRPSCTPVKCVVDGRLARRMVSSLSFPGVQ
jgi:hypothetical protein